MNIPSCVSEKKRLSAIVVFYENLFQIFYVFNGFWGQGVLVVSVTQLWRIVELPVFPFNSVRFCIMYYEALLLGAYTFMIVVLSS